MRPHHAAPPDAGARDSRRSVLDISPGSRPAAPSTVSKEQVRAISCLAEHLSVGRILRCYGYWSAGFEYCCRHSASAFEHRPSSRHVLLWLVLSVKAWQGEVFKLPFFGLLAERLR